MKEHQTRHLPRNQEFYKSNYSNETSGSTPKTYADYSTNTPSNLRTTKYLDGRLYSSSSASSRATNDTSNETNTIINGTIIILLIIIFLILLFFTWIPKAIRCCRQNQNNVTNTDTPDDTYTTSPSAYPISYASNYTSDYETNYPSTSSMYEDSNYERYMNYLDLQRQQRIRLNERRSRRNNIDEEVIFPSRIRQRLEHRMRRQQSEVAAVDIDTTATIEEKITNQLKISTYSDYRNESKDECCSICINDYQDDDLISQSYNENCSHIFHKECIMQWLLKHSDCPCCRLAYIKTNTHASSTARLAMYNTTSHHVDFNEIQFLREIIQSEILIRRAVARRENDTVVPILIPPDYWNSNEQAQSDQERDISSSNEIEIDNDQSNDSVDNDLESDEQHQETNIAQTNER